MPKNSFLNRSLETRKAWAYDSRRFGGAVNLATSDDYLMVWSNVTVVADACYLFRLGATPTIRPVAISPESQAGFIKYNSANGGYFPGTPFPDTGSLVQVYSFVTDCSGPPNSVYIYNNITINTNGQFRWRLETSPNSTGSNQPLYWQTNSPGQPSPGGQTSLTNSSPGIGYPGFGTNWFLTSGGIFTWYRGPQKVKI